MSGTLQRWLDRLQLSPSSQRALTEAMLDGRHEVSTAPTLARAVFLSCRAGLGFGRALMFVCFRSLGEGGRLSWGTRFVCWSLILFAPEATKLSWRMFGSAEQTALFALAHWINLMPYATAMTVLTGPRRSDSPAVPLIGTVSAFAVVLTGVYLPLASAQAMPLWIIFFQIAMTTSLTILSDRLRVDRHRFAATLAVVGLLWAAALLVTPLRWGLEFGGVGVQSAVGRVVIVLWVLAVPIAFWNYFVRIQERDLESLANIRPTG